MIKFHISHFTFQIFSSRGFTLAEMLIAVSIFSVVVMIATDIFIRTQRTQRQAAALEKVQDVTRFLMTRMAYDVQTGHIDYGYYGSQTGAVITSDTLALKQNSGATTLFTTREKNNTDWKDSNDAPICGTTDDTGPCGIMVLRGAPPDTDRVERVTPDGYTIQKFSVAITPPFDSLTAQPAIFDSLTAQPAINDYPTFAACDDADPLNNPARCDLQPKVTIMMTVRGAVPGIRDPIDFSVQTTLSSRENTR